MPKTSLPSRTQKETLKRMIEHDGTIMRLRGGFWISAPAGSFTTNDIGAPSCPHAGTQTVEALIARGWIRVSASVPHRRPVYEITAAGRTIAQQSEHCTNDGNPAMFTFINGDEREPLCDVCLKDVLFDIVTNNDTVSFSYTLRGDHGLTGPLTKTVKVEA